MIYQIGTQYIILVHLHYHDVFQQYLYKLLQYYQSSPRKCCKYNLVAAMYQHIHAHIYIHNLLSILWQLFLSDIILPKKLKCTLNDIFS